MTEKSIVVQPAESVFRIHAFLKARLETFTAAIIKNHAEDHGRGPVDEINYVEIMLMNFYTTTM